MIIQFLPADLEHVGGYYYSPSFLINNNNMTIQVTSSTNLTMSIEASIDDDTYFEVLSEMYENNTVYIEQKPFFENITFALMFYAYNNLIFEEI